MIQMLLLLMETSVNAASPKSGLEVNSLQNGGHYYEYGLNFLGWSADGRYYALEHIQPDYGAMACPLAMKLEIVDTTTDRWARGSGYKLSDEEKYDGDEVICTYNSLQEIQTAFRRDIAPLLKRWSIEIGNYSEPLKLSVAEEKFQFVVDETSYTFQFKSEKDYERGWEDGNGYYLKWIEPTEISIEQGKRRQYIYYYNVHSVFVSPNKTAAAFIIAKKGRAYEGDEKSFMTNGALLPQNSTLDVKTKE